MMRLLRSALGIDDEPSSCPDAWVCERCALAPASVKVLHDPATAEDLCHGCALAFFSRLPCICSDVECRFTHPRQADARRWVG